MGVALIAPTGLAGEPLRLLQFDATITEAFSRTSQLTQFPAEDGSPLSDHANLKPLSFTMRGWVSDHPILVLPLENARASVPGGNPRRRALDAFDELNRIMDNKILLELVTGFGKFVNIHLESIRANKDKTSGRILDATLTFKELIVASTETVTLPTPVQASRSGKTDLGRQVAGPPTSPDGTESTAVADSLLSKLAGLAGLL